MTGKNKARVLAVFTSPDAAEYVLKYMNLFWGKGVYTLMLDYPTLHVLSVVLPSDIDTLFYFLILKKEAGRFAEYFAVEADIEKLLTSAPESGLVIKN